MNTYMPRNWPTYVKLDKFLEIYNLQKPNQVEAESLNIVIATSETEANSRHTKALDQMTSQINFTKHSKKN